MNKNKVKSVEETFVKKTPLEHIIDLPDTYIGSIEKTDIDTWIYDESNNKMVFQNIKYIPGLYKIFDEVLVNAIDHHVRIEKDNKNLNKVNIIKVSIDPIQNKISIYNNGEGIPIVEHKEHGIYIPELIFGNLLTSSNYDKDEKKITGGKNGYGAKLANIFSTKFSIETVDATTKKKYIQVFEKNMTIKNKPEISRSIAKPYTLIEFYPDLNRFGIDIIDQDTIQLMKKRVIDITACTNKNVSVFINEEKIECKTLEKYVSYYLDDSIEKVYEEVNERWEVVVALSQDTKFEQVSFVNGIATLKGGKHVDYVSNNIIKKIQTYASTKGIKRKKYDLKTSHIKENLFIFVKSTIENPSFDSQIKEYLTTPSSKFGSTCNVSDKFIEKLLKTALIDNVLKLTDFKDNIGLQKISGKKTSNVRGIDKLDDANKAGSNESLKCTLILTEGDSAKALAISGLSVIGRDYYGVFPLRGKVLNVRDISMKKVGDNHEISSLVKIMGLKFVKNKNKEDILKDLRYGKIMILTDADVDGSHIKGLLMNLFQVFWPQLLEIPGFMLSLATPIIKVKKNNQIKEFYTISEFNQWKETIENLKSWDIKYYKGLGTSTSEEAKEYFTNIEQKNIIYKKDIFIKNDNDNKIDDDDNSENNNDENNNDDNSENNSNNNDEYNIKIKKNNGKKVKNIIDDKLLSKSDKKMILAFDKSKAEERKVWLKSYDKNNIIEQSEKEVFYHDFIDKELIHFSDYDCKRSIPSLIDGLKPSLRKIIYSCFKRNLKKEIKISQLAGYVSENSAYHHGEQSLYDSIIGLAQNYVGSNNIELLVPKGQFGTRLDCGKDSASPRYIFTHLSEITYHIYNPLDNPLLSYNEDDGQKIEPVWYIPIIPMILINGTEGIGTGFSTKVPSHDPELVIKNLIRLMNNEPLEKMIPWFRGFQGKVEFKSINEYGIEQYVNFGNYQILDDNTVLITELPIGRWTDDYKSYLETLIIDKTNENSKQCLLDFVNHSTEKTVKIILKFKKDELESLIKTNKFESLFKLSDTKYTNYSNMHLYNNKEIICKYECVEDILKEYYMLRLIYYDKRKEYMLKSIKKELNIIESKIRFINEFINGTINIIQKEDDEIEKLLEEHNYPKFSSESDEDKFSYDYLLNMRIRTFTKNKIDELNKQYENKLGIYNVLINKSDKDLWKEDLEKLLDIYRLNLEKYNKIMETENLKETHEKKKIKVTKKKAV